MSFFEKIKKLFEIEEPVYRGAIPEEIPESQIKIKDVVGAIAPVNWVEKKSFRRFPVLNQFNTFMCGAFALSKYAGALFILNNKTPDFVEMEEVDIYQKRSNRYTSNNSGMSFSDMFRIAKEGLIPKLLTNLHPKVDADADKAIIADWKKRVGKEFAISGEAIYIPNGDFETIASVIQITGKTVISFMYFTSREWSKEFPKIMDAITVYGSKTLRHFVVYTDFGLINGKKYLHCEDSAHFGGVSERNVSEEFFKARNYGSMYTQNFKFASGGKPSFDGTIISVQKCLRAEGFFPTNISFLESVGPVTRKGLLEFQKAHGLPETGQIDEKTISLLKMLYP